MVFGPGYLLALGLKVYAGDPSERSAELVHGAFRQAEDAGQLVVVTAAASNVSHMPGTVRTETITPTPTHDHIHRGQDKSENGPQLALESVSRGVWHCVAQHFENAAQRSAKLP